MQLRTSRRRQIEPHPAPLRRLLERAGKHTAGIHTDSLEGLPAHGVENRLGNRPTFLVRQGRRHAPSRGFVLNGERKPRSVPRTRQWFNGVRKYPFFVPGGQRHIPNGTRQLIAPNNRLIELHGF